MSTMCGFFSIPTKFFTEQVHLPMDFGKGSVQIPASIPARPKDNFRCFLQLIQQIIERASLLCNDRFLLNTSSSLSYHSTGVAKLLNVGVAYNNFETSGEANKRGGIFFTPSRIL